MNTKAFRLNRDYLLKKAKEINGVENLHQLSKLATGVSYPTVHNYFNGEYTMRAINLENLHNLLHDGVGFSDEEIASLKFGDIFIMVDSDS